MSGFQSSLSTSDATKLLTRFAPFVWLDSAEKYFPCPVDWYLNQVQLGYYEKWPTRTTTIVQPTVTPANLNATTYNGQNSGGALNGAPVPDSNYFVLPITNEDATSPGWVPQESGPNAYSAGKAPPVYGGVIDRTNTAGVVIGYDLVYVFFYAYNGQAMRDFAGFGVHEGDIEHVVARVDADQETLLAVYYPQHGTGPYTGWYYPPGPDKPEAGGILFETLTSQRCIVYSAVESHANYPREADDWSYGAKGSDSVNQGYGWDTSKAIVLLNDPAQSYWLDYAGRFGGAKPLLSTQFSNSPTSPIEQGWQNLIASGPFVEREIYCQEIKGQTSRVSVNTNIAQVGLTWTFDDPNGWVSAEQLARLTVNMSHDVSGPDQRAITGITSGLTTTPPYAHTDNVYVSGLVYIDKNGERHTGYSDAWSAIAADSSAPSGATVTFRIVCTWQDSVSTAYPQTPRAFEPPPITHSGQPAPQH
jgi:hypothetical protein